MWVELFNYDPLADTKQEFRVADDHLRETLPPIIQAAFSILPHLLGVQILIQNTLLAQYYTILHNYCEESGFPSPPPPMDDVIATWNRDYNPAKQEVESIPVIARGKAIHQPMRLGEEPANRKSSTALNGRNGIDRRQSSQSIPSHPASRVMRIPSNNSVPQSAPEPSPSPEPPAYSVIGKKKPPPPPPKRINSHILYAVALYAFEGQSEGDLSFKEGDQIQVIKKTDSTDDWWEGRLNGVKGSFPANYCKIV